MDGRPWRRLIWKPGTTGRRPPFAGKLRPEEGELISSAITGRMSLSVHWVEADAGRLTVITHSTNDRGKVER